MIPKCRDKTGRCQKLNTQKQLLLRSQQHAMNILKTTALLLFVSIFSSAYGQRTDDDLIQFSGVVISNDSLNPVPFASILIENNRRGTITDIYGYFSFVAQKGDSVRFSAIGYRKARFVIPDTLTTSRYSLIQILEPDTITLREATVYPWPTREQFRQAFLAMSAPETDMDRAEKNLLAAEMIDRMDAAMPSGAETYKMSMNQYQSQLYYAGQAVPINLLNPVAWSQFIQAWKRGDFKTDRKRGGQ